MAIVSYIIRSPENNLEWDALKKILTDYRNEFNNDECFTSFDEELTDIANLYDRKGNVKLIAISAVDNSIVGCVAIQEFSPDITEMKRLYVTPQHRSQKLGQLLTERVLDLAAEMGYTKVYLDTMMEMKAAQQLYVRLGFTTISPYKSKGQERMICYGKDLKTI